MTYFCLALMYTNKCNSNCDICCFSCSPEGSEKLHYEKAINLLEQAQKTKTIKIIGIAGGEPFLYYDEILGLTSHARTLGLSVTCSTNGFWASSEEEAYRILYELKSKGLSYMKISADEFHAKYIPVDNIKNVLKAAKELGFRVVLGSAVTRSSKRLKDIVAELEDEITEFSIVEYPCAPLGNAQKNFDKSQFLADNQIFNHPCKEKGILTVMPEGDVYQCGSAYGIVPSNKLGNIAETSLEEIISKANENPYYKIIEKYGVKWFYNRIQEQKLAIDYDPKVIDICHACYNIFKDEKNLSHFEPFLNLES